MILGAWRVTAAEPANPPLTPTDIGNPQLTGATRSVANGFSLSGSGTGLNGASDQFHFAYQPCEGDFDFKVRVQSLSNTDVWAKAGLLARETLEPNSRCLGAVATPSLGGCFLLTRTTAGAGALIKGSFPANYPATWLRLQRTGDLFNAFASYDGTTWTALGSGSLANVNPVYLGLAVTSQNTNQTATAEFRDFSEVTNATVGALSVTAEALGPSSRKTGLVISEIMYHPAPRMDGKILEFVELFNSNPFFEDLSGYRLSGDIEFTFPAGTSIPGGGFLVVAQVPADVQSVYGVLNALGPYTNRLKRAGTVRLRDKIDSILLEVPYSNLPPWPVEPDGTGHSLILARPSYGEANPKAWGASFGKGGSPGNLDAVRTGSLLNVIINEFLAHTAPPAEDYVELYNHSNVTVDISGCYLSDDPATNKFQVPAGTIIPAHGFACFKETQLGFSLKAAGETIYFSSPDQSQVLDAVRYEGQAAGLSMGRFPDGAADFYPLTRPTAGAPNEAILIADIVINEIMYNPLSGDDADEYVELYNRGINTVDVGGWQFTSGLEFTFPAGAQIPAGGYLVVAKDALRLRANYAHLNAANTFGDFQGKLSNRGERLALARPERVIDSGTLATNIYYVVVDEVSYGTGGQWGHWADGGGSSLELIDPRANHRLPNNWADSDESRKSEWTAVEATGVLDNGAGTVDSLAVLLLDAGECLVDNVEVVAQSSTNNLVSNSTFESDLKGWTCQGDHVRSGLENGEGYNSSHCLHVRASKQGDTGANRVRVALTSGNALQTGRTATIRARARWLCGLPELLLRLKGNYLEAYGRLPVPKNLGTPGLPNSRARANAGPAIYDVTHQPVLPAVNEPVVVMARLQHPDGLAQVELLYRIDPSTSYVAVPMTDDGTGGDAIAGDGIYSGTIPAPAAAKLAAFYVQAMDRGANPVTTQFPNDAPRRECLVRFGETALTSSFGTYRLWLTAATINAWTGRPVLSNEELDGTFVYGNQRVVYNVGLRYSGSPWHQSFYSSPIGSQCTYAMSVPADDLVLGTTSFNKIHAPGNSPADDPTIQCEQAAYWMVRQLGLPWNYQRYVNVYVNGAKRGSLMEDTQVPGNDVVDEHFPNDADGDLFKLNGWYEYVDGGAGAWNFNLNSWCTLNKYTTSGGAHKLARYRWNWAPRAAHGTANDYSQVLALIEAANPSPGAPFTQNMEAVADMEQWLRTFAIEHAVGNWDSFGYRNAQNMYAYKPTRDKWKLLIWDFNIVLGNSGSDGGSADLFSYNYADRGMTRIYDDPAFMRAFMRTIQEIANGPMAPGNIDPVLDAKFAAFKANGLSVSGPAGIKSWIKSRRAYLLALLKSFPDQFAITSSGGTEFSSDQNSLVLAGVAPLKVKTIRINGIEYPLTWDTPQSWRIQVPLNGLTNSLVVCAYDVSGNPLPNTASTLLVQFTGLVEKPQDYLVINEIMCHPSVPEAEFVEIFNTSTNSVFDLSNYRLSGVDFTFAAGTLIEPGAYLVVAKNRSAFLAAYGSAAIIAGEFQGRLDANGETLKLIKPGATPAEDETIDEVTYANTLPWPSAADGQGASLQLIDPAQDNNRVANWTAVDPQTVTHPQWQFVSVTGAASSSRLLLYHSPFQALPDPNDIAGQWDGYIDIPGQRYDMSVIFQKSGSNQWAATFFGGGGTTPLTNVKLTSGTITFQIPDPSVPRWQGRLATNGNSMNGTFTQSGGGSTISAPFYLTKLVDPNLVWGGEVYIDDLKLVAGTIPDVGANLIHNGDFETELTNTWNIAGNHAASAFSSSVRHGGNRSLHLIANRGGRDQNTAVWQDTEPLVSGQLYTLSYWYLPTTNGVELTVRLADDSLVSVHTILPDKPATPGMKNAATARLPLFEPVFLNEVQTENIQGPVDQLGHHGAWVELVNRGSYAISLKGYCLSDSYTNLARWAFPSNALIGPNQYVLVWLDGSGTETSASEYHANFSPLVSHGAIILSRALSDQSVIMDYLNYAQIGVDYSVGSIPGKPANARQIILRPTPGAANSLITELARLRINEWMAANTRTIADPADEQFKDWFEIYNAEPQDIDLTGYRLTDDLNKRSKFIIPSGAIIPAKGYLLVWADDPLAIPTSAAPAGLHVNFKLSQNGETIALFAPDGRLVDCVTFGPQTADVSQGRSPDGQGTEWLVQTRPTPGGANQVDSSVIEEVRITAYAMQPGGSLKLDWISRPGRSYLVQFKNTISDPTWQEISYPINAEGTTGTYTDVTTADKRTRFYRVVAQ